LPAITEVKKVLEPAIPSHSVRFTTVHTQAMLLLFTAHAVHNLHNFSWAKCNLLFSTSLHTVSNPIPSMCKLTIFHASEKQSGWEVGEA